MIYKNITQSYNVLEKQNLRFPQTNRKNRILNNLAVIVCWIFVSLIGFALCLLSGLINNI